MSLALVAQLAAAGLLGSEDRAVVLRIVGQAAAPRIVGQLVGCSRSPADHSRAGRSLHNSSWLTMSDVKEI